MPRILCIVLLMAAISRLAAQVTIQQDEIVTSDVNLFDISAGSQYNITAAMSMSLALPGAGHYYIDKPKSAFAYISIDAASMFGAILFHNLANVRENQARSYAVAAAGIERAPPGAAFWRHVGAFMNAADYNNAAELSRVDESIMYLNPESWWRWGDETQQDTYNDLRQKARGMRTASSFFIGALVVNRIVSTVDLRVFQRKSLSGGIRIEPALTLDMSGAALAFEIDF